MSSSPTITETVSPQSGHQRLPAESFQDWNIRARVLRRVSQRGSTRGDIIGLVVFLCLLFAPIIWRTVEAIHENNVRRVKQTCACPCEQDGGVE